MGRWPGPARRLNGCGLSGGRRGRRRAERGRCRGRTRSGAVAEVFACGTAAVVTPISRLASDDFDVELPVGGLTRRIHERLTDIQMGRAEDPYGWTYRLA